MVDFDRVPDDALGDIAYLSRSSNRVRILDAITSDAHSIRELRELTDTSRSTLNRIISEFEDREWAQRNAEGTYTATAKGHHVAVQFEPFLESIHTIRELGDAMDVYPPTELTVGVLNEIVSLQEFDDVTLYRPTAMEPDKLFDPWTDRMRDSETLRILTGAGATVAGNEFLHDQIVSEGLKTTAVCSAPLVELFLDPGRGHSDSEDLIRRHESGGRLYRYDGTVPCNISIFDDAVFISNEQVDAGVETENDTVRMWAEAVFDRYLEEATLVTQSEMVDS